MHCPGAAIALLLTRLMMRCAVSSIARFETSMTGQPSRRWIVLGVLELLVDVGELRVLRLAAAHVRDALDPDLGEGLGSIVRPTTRPGSTSQSSFGGSIPLTIGTFAVL